MEKVTAGRDALGDFAPTFAHLNDDILFGTVWAREAELPARDRSLLTVAALIAGGNTEQLPFHLRRALDNGVTLPQLAEAITHLAFYVGWPKAWSAFTIAQQLTPDAAPPEPGAPSPQRCGPCGPGEPVGPAAPSPQHSGLFGPGEPVDPAAPSPQHSGLFGPGEPVEPEAPSPQHSGLFGPGEPVDPQCFDGQAWLTALAAPTPAGMPSVGSVTFAPGARNHWHTHSVGQVLLAESGVGYCEIEGGPAHTMQPGDVVEVPAGTRHWHGAAPHSWFAHLAITQGETTWLEPVTPQHYDDVTRPDPVT